MNARTKTRLQGTLARLSDYMQGLYPDREFGARFWDLEDDDLFFEALGYLPLVMPEEVINDIGLLAEMPRGYRLAFPIFWIEDDYWFNGWTALSNAGEWLLPAAIDAYNEIGMQSEADALAAALEVIRRGDNDYYDEATEAAYKSVENKFEDDDLKNEALLAFFRSDRSLFEFDGA